MEKRLINIDALSGMIGYGKSTIYTWISQHRIPYIKVGHTVRFDIRDIEKWLEGQKVKVIDWTKDKIM